MYTWIQQLLIVSIVAVAASGSAYARNDSLNIVPDSRTPILSVPSVPAVPSNGGTNPQQSSSVGQAAESTTNQMPLTAQSSLATWEPVVRYKFLWELKPHLGRIHLEGEKLKKLGTIEFHSLERLAAVVDTLRTHAVEFNATEKTLRTSDAVAPLNHYMKPYWMP
jgi:hypothetical protein